MGRTRGIVIGEEVDNKSKVESLSRAESRGRKSKFVEIKEKKKKEPQEELHVETTIENQTDDTGEQEIKLKSDDTQTSEKPIEKKIVKRASVKTKKKRPHSSHYINARNQIDAQKKYSRTDAIELIKKTSYTTFDGTVEIHIKTVAKKGQDPLRGLVSLPSGAPKQKKIAIADEALIEKIKTGIIDFDILIATPTFMPQLALVAKILGPKGLMPSPKSGTVVDDPHAALQELSSGKVEYKTDSLGNIHLGIGKVSWDTEKLVANIDAFCKVIPTNRISTLTVCATMGPSIKIT